MINTHSGEMIEPRVGDVVRLGQLTIDVELTTYDIECDELVRGNRVTQWSVCTLMHRPFEVGDFFDVLIDGEWRPGLGGISEDDPDHTKHMNSCCEKLYRHKDIPWRSHPDYQP